MRHIFIVFTIFWMFITIAPAQEDHLIPDVNLRAAIIEEIGLPNGAPLREEHLKWLSKLKAWNSEISDLTGLEHATNLKVFSACGNQISDLSPLSKLIQLESLSLCGNPITDLSPLSDLTNLNSLDLGLNPTSDITPLRNLTKLERLGFGSGKVEDITVLKHLVELRYLNADRNRISDIRPLAGLKNLQELHLKDNRISDFSPLAGLNSLEKLDIRGNPVDDLTPLFALNLVEFEYDEVCKIARIQPSIEERIKARTFPSVFQAWSKFLIEEGLSEDERIAYNDLQFGIKLGLKWFLTESQPTPGLSTQLGGDVENARAIRQRRLDLNPNMLFLQSTDLYKFAENAFSEDSDYWLRDANGERVVKRWERIEYQVDFTKTHVQDKIVERVVGIAACGLFDGVMFDGFAHNATGFVGRELHPATDAEIIASVTRILRNIRARVGDNFLILVNAGRSKPTAYNEYVNGSFMEMNRDYPGGYTYKGLAQIDDILLWNEENLKYPQINCLEGFGIGTEPPDSPDNLRWMRVFTTMALTHSNGYVLQATGKQYSPASGKPYDPKTDYEYIWHDFWDVDIGKPIGEKGKLYDGTIEGLFIREFTNGWAVYNRSGQAQKISLPGQTTGVASGVTSFQHTIPDLDGEMFLKTDVSADVNGDGEVNILDLVAIANAFGKAEPDLNGDGVVNIQDLVIVANAF